ncbi:DUF1385 domain-containing protein [Clostridium sp. HMP27]|uniref:DUF1385 domain-containing protein n=1 Tax=Clostridium sp. HMP27 TaxID=1487921 RepID=UPI00052C7C8E|nr:DUF1385 domain-containing protein [Clostridium sp. HMP27]KGK90694.1 membrane protein [Clostridium sp. HMP27]
MKRNCTVGGQAVIEGVMMRGSKGIATAVRKENGEIEVKLEKFVPYSKRNKLFNIPIIRGFVSLIESLIIGIKTLNYSASFFEEEEENKSTFDKWFENKFKEKSDSIIATISLIISLIFSVLLFFILPNLIASGFKLLRIENTIMLNIIEGIIRVSIFLAYLYFIGKLEDIKRVFEYHGAEHKTIFCYEQDDELISEKAKKYPRFHPRCGTNFMFLVMIVSIILFSAVGWNSWWENMLWRIVLLPFVSGITYELIKWLGRSKSNLSGIIAYPGLMLQKLTTREPDLSQLEVAIKAIKAAEGIDVMENGENQ